MHLIVLLAITRNIAKLFDKNRAPWQKEVYDYQLCWKESLRSSAPLEDMGSQVCPRNLLAMVINVMALVK